MKTISTQINADIETTIKDRGVSSKCKKGRYLIESTSLHVEGTVLVSNCRTLPDALDTVTTHQHEFITGY